MSDEQEPIDHQLQQMTTNPRLAEATKEALKRLRQGGAGPELAEMATEVLEGRTDLRTVGRSSVYAAQLTEAADRFRDWQASLTPEEREALDRSTHEYLGDAENR